MIFNKGRWLGLGLGFSVMLLAGCAAQQLHRDGLNAIERGDYETGVADLGQAVAKAPDNIGYRLDFQARREAAVQTLIADADSARGAAQFEAAASLYRRVLAIDPVNDRARKGLEGIEQDKRHVAAVAEARKDFERRDFDTAESKLRLVLNEDPGYAPAQELGTAINIARGPTTAAPRLKTRDNRKVTLQLRDAPTKMVFEVLQRETGINFVLDKDVKSETKTTIFVQDVPVEEAIDLVLDQNGLARQILSSNMVMIYPNKADKQKEYEQQIVRTFYLTNAEPKEVEAMLKAVLGAKNMYIDERAGSVMLRDTPDAVRMAEKLVASLDVAEPEVMLEVEVLEISKSRLQDLGIAYPSSATFTPTGAATAATGVTGATSAALSIAKLGHQNSNTITVTPTPSVTVNAMKQAGAVNTLASPRIRARNKEKAKILIGSRLPVITSGVSSVGGSLGVTATSNVQYLDVGLTLEVQPTVHLDSDVAIKVNLEVSSVLKQLTITQPGGGTTIAYEIGTRNANTLLRLRDGETQILAGLIQDSDTRSANSIPGLGDIPILGHLFGTYHTDREKNEVVLSITPRIIRMQPRPSSEVTEFWYGSESRTRTGPYSATDSGADARRSASPPMAAPQYAPAPSGPQLPGPQPVTPSVPAGTVSAPLSGPTDLRPVPPPASAALPAPTGLASTAVPAAIAATEVPAEHARSESPPEKGGGDASAATASGPPNATAGTASSARNAVTLQGPSSAKVGDEFQVVLQLSTQSEITRLRSQLRFDSTALQLTSATLGDIVPTAAGSPSIQARAGGAQLEVLATPDEPVHGSGSLMVLQFKALAARSTRIAAMVNVLGGNNVAVGSSSAEPLSVAVTP